MKTIDQITLAFHFEKAFGTQPRIFRAPGRVNLIGEHTDYNDGYVMPAAVGFSTYVAIAPRPDRKLRDPLRANFPATSNSISTTCPKSASAPGVTTCWGCLRSSAAWAQACGREPACARGSPDRRGTQLVRGTGSVFSARSVKPHRHEFAAARSCPALPPGREQFRRSTRSASWINLFPAWEKRDTLSSSIAALLNFRFVPIPAGLQLVVCNTMVKHDLATGAYNTRREECEEGVRAFREMGSCDSRVARCIGRPAGPALQRSSRHDLEAMFPRSPRKPANARRRPRSYGRRTWREWEA